MLVVHHLDRGLEALGISLHCRQCSAVSRHLSAGPDHDFFEARLLDPDVRHGRRRLLAQVLNDLPLYLLLHVERGLADVLFERLSHPL